MIQTNKLQRLLRRSQIEIKKSWVWIRCWTADYCPKHDRDLSGQGQCWMCFEERAEQRRAYLDKLKKEYGELDIVKSSGLENRQVSKEP